MVKKNSIPARIDNELFKEINDFAKDNDISFRRASKEFAKIMKQMKLKKSKVKF